MKGAGKSWKARTMKPLSQLHLFVATTSGRRRNPTSENFSQRSNFPFFLLPSATGRIIFPRDFGRGTITNLSKIHRERVSSRRRCSNKEAKEIRRKRCFPVARRNSSFKFQLNASPVVLQTFEVGPEKF